MADPQTLQDDIVVGLQPAVTFFFLYPGCRELELGTQGAVVIDRDPRVVPR